MAFPGDRKWKIPLTIPHEAILGEIVHDGLFRKTHVDLPDEFLTLGHEQAPQDGGADLAASLDELGTVQIPCYVVRCALNATPASSRVEIWFRRQDVSDVADTVIWLWYGSTTETAPAVTASYGRNDVFDGTTGTGDPVAAWGVWLFDEDPSDPSPCYKDVSGNDNGVNDGGTITRVDAMDVRGVQTNGYGNWVVGAGTWSPGTGDFTLLWAGVSNNTTVYINGTNWQNLFIPAGVRVQHPSDWFFGPAVATTGATVGIARDGGSLLLASGSDSDTATGIEAYSFELAAWHVESDSAAATVFAAFLDTAVNGYWIRAWNDCLVSEATFWEVGAITAAAVQAVYTVSPIAVGSEVRYYEQPHPQQWTIDFDGLDVADQDGTYFLFQVMGSGGASDHYAWFDLDDGSADPAVADRTGHEVDVTTGDTDEDIAAAVATVLAGVTGLDATVSGTVVTVTNERDGELEPPADATGAVATGADIDTVVLGGTSDDEITGVETSAGTSWGGVIAVTRPRMVTIVIIRPGYEPVRLEGYVVQPANTLVPVSQRVDLNYSNPT